MENLNLRKFYIGQKVYYNGKGINSIINYPAANTEVCTIKRQHPANGHWVLAGYETSKEGNDQTFAPQHLEPIQEQKFPLIKLTKVIEKEKQLISAN